MTRKRTGFFCRFLLRGWWWGLALIGLPVLFLLSLLFNQTDVETDIRNRTLKTLTDNNIGWADTNLDFRGRDVLLTGKAPNQAEHDQAVKLLSDVEGVRVVDSEVVIEGAEESKESQPVQEAATDTTNQDQEAQNIPPATSSQMNANTNNQAQANDDASVEQAEAQRQAAEAAKQAEAERKAEEARQRAEADAKRKAEEAEAARKRAEAEAKRKAEEEAARQAKAEADAKRQSCQVRLNDLLAKQNIVFESNVSTIKPQSKTLLKSLSSVILECKAVIPEKGIKISGHTDNLGDSDTNLALSQARADAVKNALAIAGVESRFMEAVGYGETQAIAPNSTAKGRAKNRRISLEINQQ